MFRHFAPLIAAAALAVSAGNAFATLTYLHAELTNADENPATNPTVAATGTPRVSFGHADFWLDSTGPSMTMTVTVTGVDFGGQSPDTNDNLLNAHIHANATVTPTSANAGVVWGFYGSPFNDPDDRVVTPFVTGVGGTITGIWDGTEGNGGTTLSLQMANILAGHSYINFHTTQFSGGELRGFLLLPEPASLSILSLPAIALFRRRAR